MAVDNTHGPIRWLMENGKKCTFRSKKDLDRHCQKNGHIIKPDYDLDETGRIFKIVNGPVTVENLKVSGVERGFKTTEQKFEEWFAEWCVGAKLKGSWPEPESLRDVAHEFFMGGLSSTLE